MALWHRLFLVIGAPRVQPDANFLACQVAAGFLVGRPRGQGFLLESLAGFLALKALKLMLDSFEHDPVGRATALNSEVLNTTFQYVVDLEGRYHSGHVIT